MIHIAKWQIAIIVAILVAGIVFALPNFLGYRPDEKLPGWVPGPRVNLGLDLQGGSHLLYEVGIDEVVKERLNGVVDSIRSELYQKKKIGYTDLGVDNGTVHFKLTDPSTADEVRRILRDIGQGMEVSVSSSGEATMRFTDQALTELKRNIVSQSIEVVRKRIDELGTREPSIQRQGQDRILIQLPGVNDPAEVKRIIGTTAKMTFRLVDENVLPNSSQIPPTDELLPTDKPDPRTGKPEMLAVQKRVMVSGENLTHAAATYSQQTGQPVVSFTFDSIGGKKFGEVTRDNVGKRFAIVLDNKVISAPVIRTAIMGGSGIIEGNFTIESA
ncbi:MAG: protein translocase subunit SecD, partial [Rhodospirillaceae bacterium]|nr:protein translocase subunit SecD [Rhodospirillaceae bacterium]